jgi:hypothetical protein
VRLPATKAIRVGPGDQVIVRGQLPASVKLGRLYVFASEKGAPFSPYVHGVADMLVANGRPQMMSQLSMRLVPAVPVRELSFVSDIDGYICIMQEVDTAAEPGAKVRVVCTINPELGWMDWLKRKAARWQRAPKPMS